MKSVIRRVRLVPVAGVPGPPGPVDLALEGGVVAEVAPRVDAAGADDVVEAEGRWAIPGLWDQHVHMRQWALSFGRLDVSGTAHPGEVVRRVAEHVAALPAGAGGSVVTGAGYRSATWPEPPSVAALDAVSADHPVVLISGDVHNGWLNSRALSLLGMPPREGALDENEWFAVLGRLAELPGDERAVLEGYRAAVRDALAKGVVGIVDFEMAPGWREWPVRYDAGVTGLRVRAATYPDHLGEVVAAGLRTGDRLSEATDLLTMGPLKVIADGSLNTGTAFCREPYAAPGGPRSRGTLNLSPAELTGLMREAAARGLECAIHAIGDAANGIALDAFAATGAPGSVEHAQLMSPRDVRRMGRLRVRASVQPAHLLDDRDVAARLWGDRLDECFPLGSLAAAGVPLAFGSDAPVAPLDPWLAMAAAVHRSAGDREPWNPPEHLTAAQALAASTDGRGTLRVGSRADVVLLDRDPLADVGDPIDTAAVAAHLRTMPVAATFVAGERTRNGTRS